MLQNANPHNLPDGVIELSIVNSHNLWGPKARLAGFENFIKANHSMEFVNRQLPFVLEIGFDPWHCDSKVLIRGGFALP